jgi:hypothetical protein
MRLPHSVEAQDRFLDLLTATSRSEALKWAAKFAVARRCAQEVREFVFDPTV